MKLLRDAEFPIEIHKRKLPAGLYASGSDKYVVRPTNPRCNLRIATVVGSQEQAIRALELALSIMEDKQNSNLNKEAIKAKAKKAMRKAGIEINSDSQTSIYNGVSKETKTDSYRCTISKDYKNMAIGTYDTEVDAAYAYDMAIKHYFKQKSDKKNFKSEKAYKKACKKAGSKPIADVIERKVQRLLLEKKLLTDEDIDEDTTKRVNKALAINSDSSDEEEEESEGDNEALGEDNENQSAEDDENQSAEDNDMEEGDDNDEEEVPPPPPLPPLL